jgi:precorrin-2 dehydrogenase / sirohydrochlorin ferrochelatase
MNDEVGTMKHYPISLSLEKKLVVIVGGGMISERKVRKLLGTGATITIISPEITENIKLFVTEGKVEWKNKLFSDEDISDAFLIIAATNSKHVNKQVYEACKEQQLLSVVDDPHLGNFIVPSTLTRGKLAISVSTAGASPGLAKKIVADLANQYDDAYESYIDFLAECRGEIQNLIADSKVRQEMLKVLLEPVFLEYTKSKLYKERQELFLRLLNSNGEIEG